MVVINPGPKCQTDHTGVALKLSIDTKAKGKLKSLGDILKHDLKDKTTIYGARVPVGNEKGIVVVRVLNHKETGDSLVWNYWTVCHKQNINLEFSDEVNLASPKIKIRKQKSMTPPKVLEKLIMTFKCLERPS